MRTKFLFILCFALCAGACSQKAPYEQKDAPAQRAYGIVLSESSAGQSLWQLKVKEADFFDNGQYLTLKSPVLILNEDSQNTSTVTSQQGRYDVEKHLITLSKKVVGTSGKENAKIETEEIFYDTQTKKIWSDSPVKLTRGKITVKGAGLRAQDDLSQVEILRQKTSLPADIQDIKQAAQ